MEPFEWSTLQLMSIVRRNEEKDKINHSPIPQKLTLHFLVKQTGWWLVTYIYEHYTFEPGHKIWGVTIGLLPIVSLRFY